MNYDAMRARRAVNAGLWTVETGRDDGKKWMCGSPEQW